MIVNLLSNWRRRRAHDVKRCVRCLRRGGVVASLNNLAALYDEQEDKRRALEYYWATFMLGGDPEITATTVKIMQ